MSMIDRDRWLRDALANNGGMSQERMLKQLAARSGADRLTVERELRRWKAYERMSPKYISIMAELLHIDDEQEIPNTPRMSQVFVHLVELEDAVKRQAASNSKAHAGYEERLRALERQVRQESPPAAEGTP